MKLDTNKALKSVKYNNVDVPLASGGMNVFMQETQPTAQNGLWIKRAKNEVSKVLIKSDYYLADGSAAAMHGTFTNNGTQYKGRCKQNCVAVGKKIYVFGGNYYNVYGDGGSFAYDTETDVFTTLASYQTSGDGYFYRANSREAFYHNGIISFFCMYSGGSTCYLQKYDPSTNTFTRTSVSYGSAFNSYNIPVGAKQVGNQAYVVAGYSGSNSSIRLIISKYDIETEVFTTLHTREENSGMNNDYCFLVAIYDDTLFIMEGATLVGKYNIKTGVYTYVNKAIITSLPFSYAMGTGMVQVLNKVYGIGGSTYGSDRTQYAKGVFVYDLVSGAVELKAGILPYAMGFGQAAAAIVDGAVYVIGGVEYESNTSNYRLNTVIKYAIQTNEFDNGTVVCQPSAISNLTEMYSDTLSTLDFGVTEVYYQSASGFSKQPAAIIKNGVATDIGGGVTPEPGPTPTLEGTWVLNDTLVAPESNFNETVAFTAGVSSPTLSFTGINYDSATRQLVYLREAGQSSFMIYNFANNSWNSQRTYKTINFSSGATASDKFLRWLASNATKQ